MAHQPVIGGREQGCEDRVERPNGIEHIRPKIDAWKRYDGSDRAAREAGARGSNRCLHSCFRDNPVALRGPENVVLAVRSGDGAAHAFLGVSNPCQLSQPAFARHALASQEHHVPEALGQPTIERLDNTLLGRETHENKPGVLARAILQGLTNVCFPRRVADHDQPAEGRSAILEHVLHRSQHGGGVAIGREDDVGLGYS